MPTSTMPMYRLLAPLLVLTLTGMVTACADLDTGPAAAAPAQVAWGAPAPATPAMLRASAPAPAASAASDAPTAMEPIVIRGNDRLVAPPPVPFKGPAKGASTALKFESAPVAEVVKVVLGDLLKVDYVVHPPLNGTITLTTRQAVSPDRALLLLESALQANVDHGDE